MDAIPDATEEDATAMPNIIFTFHKWMEGSGKSTGTSKTYARTMLNLFEEDGKSPAGMATMEYFTITKASFRNKSCNGQRSASVRQFMDFWSSHGDKPFEDCKGDKMYQLKSGRPRKDNAATLKALSENEGVAERKLRADLELPPTGWSVVVRTRQSGDVIAAVSPGGTAYYTRETVDKRLGRKRGVEPPALSLPPAEASKPSKASAKKEEAARPAADEKAASKKSPAAAQLTAEVKKEPSKEEAKKEEAKKDASKKDEAKKDEAKKEEAKKEEAKEELKDELKEEAKKEEAGEAAAAVKEEEAEAAKDGGAVAELKSEEQEDNGLKKEEKEDSKDDVLAAMTAMLEESEQKSKKTKRHREKDPLAGLLGDAEDTPPADLATPAVETDTEYPETDVSACPEKIYIKESGSHKADGTYYRMERASRGKPCYLKSGERAMYLFWNKKWRIGNEFGSTKNFAMNKDAGTLTPCEPYPHVWKVLDRKDRKEKKDKGGDKPKEYVKQMTMRIIDSQVMSLCIQSDLPDMVVPEEDYQRAKKLKRRVAVPASEANSQEAKGEAVPGSAEKPAKEPAAAANGLAPSQEGPGEDSEEEEADSSQSESNSSSSSSEDSGASDSEAEDQGGKDASKEVKAPAAPRPVASLHASEQKAQEFEARLRMELKRMNAEERVQRMQKVKEVLTGKCDSTRVTGMGPEKILAMLAQLEKDFCILAKPKPPSAPPPAHLLRQPAVGAPVAAAEDHRSLADLAAESQPMTPEGGEPPIANSVDWWKRQRPTRSALRKPNMPRNTRRRITYREYPLVQQVEVSSFRSCGEQLWFIAPGSYVACDACEKEVSQAMGCLQGAPMQSQFAQNRFLCSECSGMA